MSFGTFVLIGFASLCIVFLWMVFSNAKKAGGDSVLAKQGKQAGKARRDAQEAERRVDGMSDDDAAHKLRDEWSRD